MKKKVIVGIVALLVIVGGAYAIFHKSSSPASDSSSNSSKASTAIIQTKTASGTGQYLADANGDALYTYGADTSGVSNCSGSCIYAWPVYSPTSSTVTPPANLTVISRSDGTKQYAYKGLPLYTFSNDPAGKVTGDNVSNFHVAKP